LGCRVDALNKHRLLKRVAISEAVFYKLVTSRLLGCELPIRFRRIFVCAPFIFAPSKFFFLNDLSQMVSTFSRYET
jgi:hypothetical protein